MLEWDIRINVCMQRPHKAVIFHPVLPFSGACSLWTGLVYGLSFRGMELLLGRFSPLYGAALRCIILTTALVALRIGVGLLMFHSVDEFLDEFPYGPEMRTFPVTLILGLSAERLLIGPALTLTWGEVSGACEDVERASKAAGAEE